MFDENKFLTNCLVVAFDEIFADENFLLYSSLKSHLKCPNFDFPKVGKYDVLLAISWQSRLKYQLTQKKKKERKSFFFLTAKCDLCVCLQVFEGLKAYRCVDGKIRMFRPMENMKRMISSCERSRLPVSYLRTVAVGVRVISPAMTVSFLRVADL